MMLSLINTPQCTFSIISNRFVPVFVDDLNTPLIFFKGQVYSYTMTLFRVANNMNSPYPVIIKNQIELFRRLKLEGLINIDECWIKTTDQFNKFHHDIFVSGGMSLKDPESRHEVLQQCSFDTMPHISLKDLVA